MELRFGPSHAGRATGPAHQYYKYFSFRPREPIKRSSARCAWHCRPLSAALLPFLAAELVALGLTVAFPKIVRPALPAEPGAATPAHPLRNQDVDNVLENLPAPGDK